ncbi:hypothetical protein SAMN02746065_101105 [Desulfocicer vacuolatum DSM 3385]|uniref:Uncharacterized protein n=1 Tax=Desulfocicer vacuolatum DSM 3385 TaxID=1121400 RepID=A0A1W1YJC4_9BACT|nr:hypothetical protein [Desulfocicer vacuolatum]SMC36330.1 hypothetical protein SAMN02746065_101105 [Desulfocicer vacuolatum DSM 3385]
MTVPAYQIQNILTLYCRKLKQSSCKEQGKISTPLPLQLNVIAKSKKETVINKVKESIVSKITIMGPRRYMETHVRPTISVVSPLRKSASRKNHLFSFTSLEKGNIRIQKSISMENKDGIWF